MKKKLFFNKQNDSISHGFTLVELLVIIAILSVIMTISIYFVIGIVNNSKKKSYETTINNVETMAGNYILEQTYSTVWVVGADGNYEYQCVTVQNLIDTGYFKGDILESKVGEDTFVKADDYIYIERDSNSKSITKQILLVGDNVGYKELCADVNVIGDIKFEINPSGWAKQKEVIIIYDIYNNVDNVSNYKYSYDYSSNSGNGDREFSNSFTTAHREESLLVTSNGDIYANILDNEGKIVKSKTLEINGIDLVAPAAEIKSKNNVAATQTVSLNMSDISGSGVDKYYFGQTNPSANIEWIDIGNTESVSKTATVNNNGKWYLAVVDVVGNMRVVEATFYQTTLSISNGTVTPNTVMTMSGDKFIIPVGIANNNYKFVGWYGSSNFSGSLITEYAPISNSTLYGKTVLDDVTGPTIIFGTDGSNGKWIKTAASTITVTDDLSGVDNSTLKYIFSLDKVVDLSGVNVATSTTSSVTKFVSGNNYSLAGANGLYYLHAYACDNAGNCTTKVSKVFKLDNIPPTLTCKNGNKIDIQHYKLDKYSEYVFDSNGDKIVLYSQTVEILFDENGNKCYGYHRLLFQKSQASHDPSCSDAFGYSDNNGVVKTSCTYAADYDDDDNTYCMGPITKSDGTVVMENCIRKATACNCIHDDVGKYCKVEREYKVWDEAGNMASDTVVIYMNYNDPSYSNANLRGQYCTSDRKPKYNAIIEKP